LTIARLDSGADSIHPEPADISKLCRWVMDQMHLLAEERDISMRVETISMMVDVDTARMKQVLVNLIDNAIKYTPDGGRVQLVAFPSDRMAIIEVSDTGIGIPANELPHVFDRFFRADRARSRAWGGSGLGLSIVKSILHAHRGSIVVRSTEGRGTLVKIELPLSSSTATPTTGAAPGGNAVLVEATAD
jgi:signal transduction histidine kinase